MDTRRLYINPVVPLAPVLVAMLMAAERKVMRPARKLRHRALPRSVDF